jgi:hypothetical protein
MAEIYHRAAHPPVSAPPRASFLIDLAVGDSFRRCQKAAHLGRTDQLFEDPFLAGGAAAQQVDDSSNRLNIETVQRLPDVGYRPPVRDPASVDS